jgi:hypothetical protein
MSKSFRSHEGYMMIDNRQGPGVDDAVMRFLGYPTGAGKGLFEAATYTCSHCNVVVILEQARTRERGFCRGCSRQICDACNLIKEKTKSCLSMEQIIDETLEAAVKQASPGSLILLGS